MPFVNVKNVQFAQEKFAILFKNNKTEKISTTFDKREIAFQPP